jgi:hypothetical protein
VFDRQTPTPKLPLVSLSLLLLTYTTFGWLIYDWTSDRRVWLIVAAGITVLGAILTYPSRSVSLGFGGFFKTDTRALILIILASIVSVALLTWLQFFVDTIVLCSAGLLASLDLKIRGWSKALSLLLIIGWQLLGMSAGLCLHYLYVHPVTNLPAYFYTDYWIQQIDRIFSSF